MLFRDVRILPTILDSAESEKDQECSEALNQESFELMANLMCIKDLQVVFESAGATIQKLQEI